jgi:hypothetical protein
MAMLETIALRSPSLRRLYEDWRALPRDRFPRRADFDPVDFRYILGSISLIEVFRDPLRLLFRVHGTVMAEKAGTEVSGKFLDEVPDTTLTRVARLHYGDVVATECPSVAWHVAKEGGFVVWEAEGMVLPMSRDGRRLDFMLGALVHHRHPVGVDLPPAHTVLTRLPG